MVFKCTSAALPPLGQVAPLGTEPVSVRLERRPSESCRRLEVLLSEGTDGIPPGLAWLRFQISLLPLGHPHGCCSP